MDGERRASLQGALPDSAVTEQHNSLDDDGYAPTSYFSSRPSGNHYDVAGSSHENLTGLEKQLLNPDREQPAIRRPQAQHDKPSRSESQQLADLTPQEIAAQMGSKSTTAVPAPAAGTAKVGIGEEDDDPEYRQTGYFDGARYTDEPGVNRSSSHLDLQDAPAKV